MKRAIILSLILYSVAQGANEIRAFVPGAPDCFAVVREVDGDVWYVVGQVFEIWGTGARTAADYVIALVDKTGGMWVGDMDSNIGAGQYYIVSHQDTDSAPADADPPIWQEYGDWDGSTWIPSTLTAEDIRDAILDDATRFSGADIAGIKAVTDVLPNAGALTDIDTGINNIETTVITNAAGADIAADIIAIKAETVNILTDTGTTIPALIAALNNITADEVWAATVEGIYDFKDYMRLMASVMFGKASGGGTTNIIFRDTADSTDRIDETIDAMGNRTSVTLDPN